MKFNGSVKWRNREILVRTVLGRKPVDFEEIADGVWAVYFRPVRLGTLDERVGRIRPTEALEHSC